MFDELRKFLLFVNKKHNEDVKKFKTYTLTGVLILSLIGFLFDIFLEPNHITHFFKAIIVILNGTTIFSILFTQTYRSLNEEKENFRENFSYKQRINISIIGLFVVAVLFSLFVDVKSPFYTFLASILFSYIIILLTFIRPTKEEHLRNIYGLKDVRDYKHSEEVEKRNQEFEERKRKKKEEKNKKE